MNSDFQDFSFFLKEDPTVNWAQEALNSSCFQEQNSLNLEEFDQAPTNKEHKDVFDVELFGKCYQQQSYDETCNNYKEPTVKDVWESFDLKQGFSQFEALRRNHSLESLNSDSNPDPAKIIKFAQSQDMPEVIQPSYSSESLIKSEDKDGLIEKIDGEAKVACCLNRKDVVIKSILRSMRKYYSDLLQDNTAFKRKIRNIKKKHQLLLSCSLDLAKSLGLSEYDENISYYLACLAFPNDLKKVLKNTIKSDSSKSRDCETGLSIINNVEGALSKYSKKVLNDFIKMPEVCVLLLNYLSKVQHKEYKGHYKMLKDLATDSISEYNLTSVDSEEKNKVEGRIIHMIR